MLSLADASGGRYAYVRGPSDLSQALDQELVAAERTVAREVLLRIRPRDGARVSAVYGYPTVERDGETWVRLRDLESEGHVKVVASLQTPVTSPGAFAVADLVLSYRPVKAPQGQTHSEASLTLGHTVTRDQALVAQGRDRAVLEAGARAFAAQALDEATRVYARGRTRDARRLLEQRLERVLLENATLGSAEVDRTVRTYGAAGAAFERTPPSSYEGRDLVKGLKLEALEATR
jgi:hypothetical protein